MKAISILWVWSLWQVWEIQLKSNRGICPHCANCLVFLRCKAENVKILIFAKKKVSWQIFLKYCCAWISIDLQLADSHWLSGNQLFIHLQIHPHTIWQCIWKLENLDILLGKSSKKTGKKQSGWPLGLNPRRPHKAVRKMWNLLTLIFDFSLWLYMI